MRTREALEASCIKVKEGDVTLRSEATCLTEPKGSELCQRA